MRILYDAGDIFELPRNRNEAVCITTNGVVKKNGCAVMGAGIAKQANMSFNGLARDLGTLLSKYGNRTYDMGFYNGDSFHQSFVEEGMAMPRIRLGDKFSRFKTLTQSGGQQVTDESIRDTLMDLANYALMTILELDGEKNVG